MEQKGRCLDKGLIPTTVPVKHQMTASQVPYDAIDWLQMGVYFLTLPLIALFGATLGLIGRVRRGGVLWSMSIGLLGGAVTCILLTICITTLPAETASSFFDLFLADYRWRFLCATAIATLACSFAAALARRLLFSPGEIQPIAFSIRSMLLVQVLAFISLGSFIGLRLYMIEKSGRSERLRPENLIPGWELWRGGEEACVLRDNLSSEEIRLALSPDKLREVAKIPHLYGVHLFLDGNWKIDLKPLARTEPLFLLGADCINPSPAMVEELAQISAKELWLSGDFRRVDLSPIAKRNLIEGVTLSSGRFTRHTIESLAEASNLKKFWILCKLDASKPTIERWPSQLHRLIVDYKSNLRADDLTSLAGHANLVRFDAIGLLQSDESIKALASIATLNHAKIVIGPLSPAGYEALASLKVAHVMLIVKSQALVHSDLEQMLRIEGLEVLDLYDAVHGDEGLDLVAKKSTLTRINVASVQVTSEAMLQLAALPKLDHLGFPKHLAANSFVEDFHAKRAELGLPFVNLVANQRASAQASPSKSEPIP
jgi:hypothetical protein